MNNQYKLIDTHAHLDFEELSSNLDLILDNAKQANVEKVIIPGVTITDIEKIISIIEKYECIYGAVAAHPSEAKTWTDCSYRVLKEYASHPKIIAIGETGLDYYWDKTFIYLQKQIFKEHINLAKELNLPLIVHDREAHADILDILKKEQASKLGVIMHCFSGSLEFAMECIKEGFYISLGGPVTFKNSKKPKEVAKNIPLESLLIETDSPFLSPHPYRGKTNEPANIKLVVEEIAKLRDISPKEVADATTQNACNIFKLKV